MLFLALFWLIEVTLSLLMPALLVLVGFCWYGLLLDLAVLLEGLILEAAALFAELVWSELGLALATSEDEEFG